MMRTSRQRRAASDRCFLFAFGYWTHGRCRLDTWRGGFVTHYAIPAALFILACIVLAFVFTEDV
jgi:hypothetical protein